MRGLNQSWRGQRFPMKVVASLTVMSLVMVPSVGQAQGPIAVAARREAVRLAVAQVIARDSVRRSPRLAAEVLFSTSLNTPAPQAERSDDWGAVRRLEEGTRVHVTTRQGQDLRGTLTTAGEDTLQMVISGDRKETLLRDDVSELRLARHSIGHYVGLGLLAGGISGLAIGKASECDCDLRGLSTALGAIYGPVGGAIGGWMVGSALRERPERLVYLTRAPSVGFAVFDYP